MLQCRQARPEMTQAWREAMTWFSFTIIRVLSRKHRERSEQEGPANALAPTTAPNPRPIITNPASSSLSVGSIMGLAISEMFRHNPHNSTRFANCLPSTHPSTRPPFAPYVAGLQLPSTNDIPRSILLLMALYSSDSCHLVTKLVAEELVAEDLGAYNGVARV